MEIVRLLAAISIVPLLAGCAVLSQTINDQVGQSQYCSVIKGLPYREGWTMPSDYLKALAGQVLSEEACELSDGRQGSRFIQLCEGQRLLQDLKIDSDSDGKCLTCALEEMEDRLDRLVINLDRLRNQTIGCAHTPVDHDRDDQRALVYRNDMARCWLKRFQGASAEGVSWLQEVADLQADVVDITRQIQSRLGKVPDAALKVEAWGRATVQSLGALRSTLSNADTALAGMARSYVPHYSAIAAVDAVHRGLKPVDRGLDRADSQAYGALSLGSFVLQRSLKQTLSDAIRKNVFERVERYDGETRWCPVQGPEAAHPVSWSFAFAATQRACEWSESEKEGGLAASMINTAVIDAARGILGVDEASELPSAVAQRMDRRPGKLEEALLNVEDRAGGSAEPPSVYAQYVQREWRVRLLAYEQHLQRWAERNRSASLAIEHAPPFDSRNEEAIANLAEISIAQRLDHEWRMSPDMGGSAALNGTEAAAAPRSEPTRARELAEISQAALATDSLKDVFDPTLQLSSTPVSINIGIQPPSFCDEPALGRLQDTCAAAGTHYELRVGKLFATNDWQLSADSSLKLEALAEAMDSYATRAGAQVRFGVVGSASAPPTAICQKIDRSFSPPDRTRLERQQNRLVNLRYQSRQHRQFVVPICVGADPGAGNRLLGALRAAVAAGRLEARAKQAVIDHLDTEGDSNALPSAVPGDDRADDRGITVEIFPHYLAPAQPGRLGVSAGTLP